MTDPAVRQQAIDFTTQVLLIGGQGAVTEEDARMAATKLVDLQVKKRGG